MRAIVLGARERSNNIGQAVVDRLNHKPDWEAEGHDCWVPGGLGGYDVPDLNYEDADALVVTLGATAIEPFIETGRAKIEEIIRGCLILPIAAAHYYVRERGDLGGRIIFAGSYAHRHPFTNGTAYCAAKAGLDMATRTLAWELTDKGFFPYIIHPYHVQGTPMWESVQEGVMESRGWTREQADEYAMKDRKLKTLMSPRDFAAVAEWLLTSPVAIQLSGSNVEMFGGTR